MLNIIKNIILFRIHTVRLNKAKKDKPFNEQDTRLNGSIADDINRVPNHHFNPVRGDEFGMNVENLEKRLREKVRENFTVL